MLIDDVLMHPVNDGPAGFAPRLLTADARDGADAEWAVAGAVAGILGLAVGVVIFICSVCAARSFGACMDAVVNWWGAGC
jgi:hypothetical protein